MRFLKAFGCITLAAALLAANATAATDPVILHQQADIPASPERVYAALLDEKQFARMTKAPAKIDSAAGGAFTLFGGRISGRNVELIPGIMVVQAWRNNFWAPGVYSMVQFKLTLHGTGTRILLDQTGFPPDDYKDLSDGWPEHYWTPLKSLPH
jgi:activator of HSP90 ATPase